MFLFGFYFFERCLVSKWAETDGVALDIGEGVTSVIAVADGSLIGAASKTVEFGGGDITRAVMAEHAMTSYLRSTRLKEKWYAVPLDEADAVSAGTLRAGYALPDGTEIELGRNRMDLPLQCLFGGDIGTDSECKEKGSGGINAPFLVKQCLERSHLDLAKDLVLSGGATMMDGFAERFSKEIKLRTAKQTAVKIERDRANLSWIGGSVLSAFSSFRERKLVTRALYKERGRGVVAEVMTL